MLMRFSSIQRGKINLIFRSFFIFSLLFQVLNFGFRLDYFEVRNLKAVRPQIFARFSTVAEPSSRQHNPPVTAVCFTEC